MAGGPGPCRGGGALSALRHQSADRLRVDPGYQEAGHDVAALAERSRRPRSNPRAVELGIQDLIVDVRKPKPCAIPRATPCRRILDSAFREYGLPKRLRSDGGPPFFAAPSPATLSTIGVWLLRLGIVLECIAPAAPQQNGRLERFHRTLKRETDVAADLRAQPRVFDGFRGRYNFERPHAALALATPCRLYHCWQMRC